MNILSNIVDDGGCGYFRVRWPLEVIQRNKLANTLIMEQSMSGNNILNAIKKADVIISRPRSEKLIFKLKSYKYTEKEVYEQVGVEKKLFVFDQDDNTFDISPLNDHYKELGTEEVEVTNPKTGKKEWLWKDGQNGFNLMQNRAWRESLVKILKESDLITTTTPTMAKFFQEFNPNVVAIPNSIDFTKYRYLDIKKKELRIGWQGGASHFEDWTEINDALVEVMKKYPEVKLVIYGSWWKGALKGIPEERIEKNPWVKTIAHPYFMSTLNLDIAIIPIKDITFNKYKSEVKFSEFSALKTPCVVRNLTPYKEVCKDGENALCYNNNRELVQKLSLLIEDKKLRQKLADNAYKWAYRERNLDKNAHLWVDAYNEALRRKQSLILQ